MKPINEIIETQPYKNNVVRSAAQRFAAGEALTHPSIYGDSFSKRVIIYKLSYSKSLRHLLETLDWGDELAILSIPSFIDQHENDISTNLKNQLLDIYNMFMKVAVEFEYDEDNEEDYLSAIGCTSYNDITPEYREQYKKDVSTVYNKLIDINDKIKEL